MVDESTTMQDAMEAIQDSPAAMIAVIVYVRYMLWDWGMNQTGCNLLKLDNGLHSMSASLAHVMTALGTVTPNDIYDYDCEVDFFGDPKYAAMAKKGQDEYDARERTNAAKGN